MELESLVKSLPTIIAGTIEDIYLINKNDKEDDYLSMLNKCVLN